MDFAQETINEYYSRTAGSLYDQAMDSYCSTEQRAAFVQGFVSLKEGRMLEIAVGTGLNVPYYPVGENVALDINAKALAYAQERASGVTFVRASASNLPFQENSFDKILMTFALSGVPCNRKALHEAKRVLRPGGVVGVLDCVNSSSQHQGGHAYMYLPDLVRNLGLNIASETYGYTGSIKKYTGKIILQKPHQ